MLDNILFALNAVLPIVLLTLLGYFLKRVNLLSKDFLKVANKLVFKVFLPVMLFLNIYNISNLGEIDWTLVLYGAGGLIGVFILAFAAVVLFIKDRRQKGVVLQCIFRSNFAIIGLPLAISLFENGGGAYVAILSAFCIPIFNILSVVGLCVFQDDEPQAEAVLPLSARTNEAQALDASDAQAAEAVLPLNTDNQPTIAKKHKLDIKKILLGIAKNPLIIGVLIGLIVLGVRALFVEWNIAFRMTDIKFVKPTLQYLSNATTPIALIVLGGQFEFGAVKRLYKQIIFGTVGRLVVVPGVLLTIAYLCFPNFTGPHFASLIALYGSPVAVSSAVMATEMGGDEELAGQFVVWTTALSPITLFIMIVIFKFLGVL